MFGFVYFVFIEVNFGAWLLLMAVVQRDVAFVSRDRFI